MAASRSFAALWRRSRAPVTWAASWPAWAMEPWAMRTCSTAVASWEASTLARAWSRAVRPAASRRRACSGAWATLVREDAG